MKKYFLIFTIFTIFLPFQVLPASLDNLITKSSIGKIKLGMTYQQARAIIKIKPKIIQNSCNSGNDSYLSFEKNNSVYIAVSDLKCNKTKIVNEIVTCNPGFKTKEGIFPGMKLAQLKRKFPDMVMRISLVKQKEYFIPPGNKNLTIEFRSADGNYLGEYPGFNLYFSKKFKTNGEVSCIKIVR